MERNCEISGFVGGPPQAGDVTDNDTLVTAHGRIVCVGVIVRGTQRCNYKMISFHYQYWKNINLSCLIAYGTLTNCTHHMDCTKKS